MLESLIINILSSLLYDRANNSKDRRAVEKFINSMSEWAISFEKRNDGTIATKGLFYQYIENYNIILKIIEYVLEPIEQKSTEKEFINNTTEKFKDYLVENDFSVSVIDIGIIKEFITEVLGKTKEFIESKINLSDKAIIYILIQMRNGFKTNFEENKNKLELSEQQIKIILEEIQKFRSDLYDNSTLKLANEWFEEQNKCAIKNLGNRYMPKLNIELEIAQIFNGIARDGIFRERFLNRADEVITEINKLKIDKVSKITQKLTEKIMAIPFDSSEIVNYTEIHDLLDEMITTLLICSKEAYKKLSNGDTKYDYEYYQINKVLSKIEDFKDYINSAEVSLTNTQFLLLEGEGGVGKSHLIADIVSMRKETNKKSLLLLGQQFNSSREPWSQIIDMLGITCSVDDLLECLDGIGAIQKSRVLIFIDAINEGEGKEFWKHNLAGMIEKIKKYSWVGLIVTIRTQYIDAVFGENNYLKESFISYTHTGFRTVEYQAIKIYFEFYKIKQPVVPFMNVEFSNPLFLRLFCEGFDKDAEAIETINITKVFERYIRVINERLSLRYGYYKAINFVKIVIERIDNYKFEINRMNNFIPIDKVIMIIIEVQKEYGISGNFIEGLISEGILTQSIDYKNDEYIYITYEKLEDHIYSSLLVEYIIQNGVQTFLEKYQDLTKNRGILESFAIQLPEKTDLEVYEVFKNKEDELIIIEALISSLKWRNCDSIKDKITSYINDIVFKRQYTYELFWEVIISIATKSSHPFNAKIIYEYLNNMKIADRDSEFIPLFIQMFKEPKSSINRLIDWANLDSKKTYVSDETIKLTVIMLTWVLSSSNKKLRDTSTRAIIKVIDDRFNVLMEFLNLFKEIDDSYIRERIYAIAFGFAVKETRQENLYVLALFIYKEVFNKNEVYPNILVRDYARNIIEYALSRNIILDIDVCKIRPPYKSEFPKIPTDKEIKQYKFDYKSPDFKDYYWAQNSILSSMKVEYSRDGQPGGYGDFGRYTFQSYFSSWNELRPMDLKNIAIRKIFDLGYDVNKHGKFDRSVSGYSNDSTERIGKKYQWIAFYELAAQVADNYEMSAPWSWRDDKEKMFCQGSFEPNLRNIDPTINIKTKIDKNMNRNTIVKSLYNNFDMSNTEWMNTLDDIPKVTDLINIKHEDNYLILNGSYDWKEDKKLGRNLYDSMQKDFWVNIKSYIVKAEDFETVIKQLKDINLLGRSMPEIRSNSSTYNKEYYWSPAYTFLRNPYYGTTSWVELSDFSVNRVLEGKVLVPVQGYLAEESNDYSFQEVISWLKPCEEIFKGLNLSYGNGNSILYDEEGDIVCFDTGELWSEDIGFAIKKEQLLKFLNDNDYKIFWTVLGEKRILGKRFSEKKEYRMNNISGIYYYEGDELVGIVNKYYE